MSTGRLMAGENWEREESIYKLIPRPQEVPQKPNMHKSAVSCSHCRFSRAQAHSLRNLTHLVLACAVPG